MSITADYYELRRAGQVICRGTYPNLGYTQEQLKDMAKYGMYLYRNGKRVKV
jgi:hypothetical protein